LFRTKFASLEALDFNTFSQIYYHITVHNPAIKDATAALNWQIHIEAMLLLTVIQN
jgi:hypothetical protein